MSQKETTPQPLKSKQRGAALEKGQPDQDIPGDHVMWKGLVGGGPAWKGRRGPFKDKNMQC